VLNKPFSTGGRTPSLKASDLSTTIIVGEIVGIIDASTKGCNKNNDDIVWSECSSSSTNFSRACF